MVDAPPRLREHALPLGLLLAVVVGLSAPALSGGFSDPDDFAHLEAGLGIAQGDAAAWRQVVFPRKGVTAVRPVPWMTWALGALLFGLKPLGYYLTNLGLHAALTSAVYALAFSLSRNRVASGIAGLILGLSASTNQAIYYLAGRDDQIANLAAVCVFLVWQRAGTSLRGRLVAAGLLTVGLLSKITVATIPVLLLFDALARNRGRGARSVRSIVLGFWPFLLAFAGVAALFVWALGHANPTALLTPEQNSSLGNVSVFVRNVLTGMVLPVMAKHGGREMLVLEAPRILSWLVVIAALFAQKGPHRRLAALGGAWLLINLVIPYPWVVVDSFRAQDSGRYLQLPAIGWALVVASACAAPLRSGPLRARLAAPAVALATVLGFAMAVTPGLGGSKAPIDAFVAALRANPPDPGGRVVVSMARLDHGITSVAASSLLEAWVPGLEERPYFFLEGQTTLWQDTRTERRYEYGKYEAVDPTFRLHQLGPEDRLLLDVEGFPRWTQAQASRAGGAVPSWDFTDREVHGWQWRHVPERLYLNPPRDPTKRVFVPPVDGGVGLELWGDRYIPPGVLGRLLQQGRAAPPHVVSPPLDLDPATVCGFELEIQLPPGVVESESEADFLVPSKRFALLAWTPTAFELGEEVFERFLVVPLSAWPGKQTATVRLDNSPAWRSTERVGQLAIVASNVRGAVDLRAVRLQPCN